MQDGGDRAEEIRVLSYNVYYAGIESTPEWSWDRRRESVASTLRFHRPDVVALQEVWQDQLPDLRERLDGYDWYGERAAGGEHTPVGYRRDRFEREGAGVFALSETPEELGSVDWGGRYPRFATHVRLTDRVTGTTLLVVSTHLDHESEDARGAAARLLVDWLTGAEDTTLNGVVEEGPTTPIEAVDAVALAGDFNCTPGSDPYDHLTSAAPLADARTVAASQHHGPAVTYAGTAPDDPDQVPKRIDHVFVTPTVDVVRTGVCADTDADGQHPSDHLPVVADFTPGTAGES
jgi:endonuclease/exonuclease/phosphatase family metal-dependent hydrolase